MCAHTFYTFAKKIRRGLIMSKKSLHIPRLPGVNKSTSVGNISDLLDNLEGNPVNIELWPNYSKYYDVPKVSFKIAHGGDGIFIKYDVEEHEVLAKYRKTNDPVYKDSCVEFFIAFDNDKSYYNLEFNRLGTCLGGFGPHEESRTFLPAELLETIKYERTILQKRETKEPVINWTLTLAIPVSVFRYHKLNSLKGKKGSVNFYKCGDNLTQPHYLAWNNIKVPKPSFHQPDFFGSAAFI